VNYNVPDRATKFVRSKDVAKEFCQIEKAQGLVEPDLLLHRVDIRGRRDNKDMIYFVKGNPVVPSFNFRKLTRLWPLAIVLGATAWFFNRRNQLSKLKSAKNEPVNPA
jgi:hypothetical protein